MTRGWHDRPPREKLGSVPLSMRFCGRIFAEQELQLLREMARDYARLGVTEIARTVCELLDWKRANGRLKDQECRQPARTLAGSRAELVNDFETLGGII
jgi:hypothetical protein